MIDDWCLPVSATAQAPRGPGDFEADSGHTWRLQWSNQVCPVLFLLVWFPLIWFPSILFRLSKIAPGFRIRNNFHGPGSASSVLRWKRIRIRIQEYIFLEYVFLPLPLFIFFLFNLSFPQEKVEKREFLRFLMITYPSNLKPFFVNPDTDSDPYSEIRSGSSNSVNTDPRQDTGMGLDPDPAQNACMRKCDRFVVNGIEEFLIYFYRTIYIHRND